MGFKLDEKILRLALRLSSNDFNRALDALTKEVEDLDKVSTWVLLINLL